MVRIGRNKFVANRLVDFDIAEIDTALSQFVTNQFCAIRDVTTFANTFGCTIACETRKSNFSLRRSVFSKSGYMDESEEH